MDSVKINVNPGETYKVKDLISKADVDAFGIITRGLLLLLMKALPWVKMVLSLSLKKRLISTKALRIPSNGSSCEKSFPRH